MVARRLMWVVCTMVAALPAYAVDTVRLATHDQPPYGTYMPDKTFDGVAVLSVRLPKNSRKKP